MKDSGQEEQQKSLSFIAGLAVAAGEIRAAEGHLLELFALSAFGDRKEGCQQQ